MQENIYYSIKTENVNIIFYIKTMHMFQNWSINKLIKVFGGMLVVLFIINIYMIYNFYSEVAQYGILVIALFIALILFHSINIKLKRRK